jgi:F420-dependent oxidoreductase-like protein
MNCMNVKPPIFGAHIPPEGRDFTEMKRLALLVEEVGFDLFSTTDHLMNMRNPNGPMNHPLECWTTLAGLSAITSKIKLAPLVACYGYRHPTVLAKMATTVDIISGGRLIFGIGAGWHEEEFKGFMGKFPHVGERLSGLKETIEICTGMFNNERFSYNGKLFTVDNVLNKPPPVQKPLPIMVGGGGEKRTLKYAAKYADISHFFARDIKTLEHKMEVIKNHCKNAGRDYDEIIKSTGMVIMFGSEEEIKEKLKARSKQTGVPVQQMSQRLGEGVGNPDRVAENLKKYIDAGLGLITTSYYQSEDIRTFAKEVIPLLK